MTNKFIKPNNEGVYLMPLFCGKTSEELDAAGKGVTDEFIERERRKLRIKNKLDD
jgi:hypothetical protein